MKLPVPYIPDEKYTFFLKTAIKKPIMIKKYKELAEKQSKGIREKSIKKIDMYDCLPNLGKKRK